MMFPANLKSAVKWALLLHSNHQSFIQHYEEGQIANAVIILAYKLKFELFL